MSFATKGYVDGKVRAAEEELKSLITGGAQNLGTWDASTNTPTITQDSGPANVFYDVKVAGTWNGMTFDVGDKIVSNKDSHWDRLATGAIKNSRELKLSNRSKETMDGISITQEEANIGFANAIKNIIIFTENVDNEVATKGAQKRPYYQIVDTPQREKGFYFVNDNNQIESFGGGVGKPDDISIEINSNNKLSIKGFENTPAHKTMEKDENGNIIWVDAINIETLNRKVQEAQQAANKAGTYAAQSGSSAIEAKGYADSIKLMFFKGTKEQYKIAIEQGLITDDTICNIMADPYPVQDD